MRTDELRELLERYPDLGPAERRRLRKLYRSATATEIIVIRSNEELARKTERLEPPDASAIDVAVAALLALVTGMVIYVATGFG